MTPEEMTVQEIKEFIRTTASAAQQEACDELSEHIRYVMKQAGEPVGTMAIMLVGAEAQARVCK